jgi:hypothetical protein
VSSRLYLLIDSYTFKEDLPDAGQSQKKKKITHAKIAPRYTSGQVKKNSNWKLQPKIFRFFKKFFFFFRFHPLPAAVG